MAAIKKRTISDLIQVLMIDKGSNMAYFSYILLRMKRIETTEIPTMGVLPTASCIELYYNPKFVETLSYLEFRYVLMHEILHVINSHAEREIKKYSHEYNNICMDLAVNSILGPENAIKGALLPEVGLFANIPRGKSYEEYTELLKDSVQSTKKKNGKGKGGGENNSDPGGGGGPQDSDDQGSGGESEVGADASGHDLRRKKGSEMSSEEREMAKGIVESMAKNALEHAKAIGNVSSDLEEMIKSLFTHKINWRKYIKNWIGEKVYMNTEPSIKFKNKRYPRFHGIIPGQIKKFASPILIAIDTSGSMSNKELSMFLAEINAIQYPKDIIQVDCEIKDIQRVGTRKLTSLKMKGRGGTEFEPAFEFAEKNKYKNMIFFTDLEVNLPKKRPNVNILWVCTTDNEAPYGKIVRLK